MRDVAIDDPDIVELYERRLVLVRPDGHVAWRGDECPDDAAGVVNRVRGAAAPGTAPADRPRELHAQRAHLL